MFIEQLGGPKILFIDDVKSDVSPIMDYLQEKEIYNLFIDARPEIDKPDKPVSSVELVFLDLYFSTQTMIEFDAEICAGLIQKTVPEGKRYSLVIFSKDIDKAAEVLKVLELINLSPAQSIVKQKTVYDFRSKSEVDRLLNDINREFEVSLIVEECYGEILDIEDGEVIVDCLIDKENKVFQKRHFDALPLSNLELVSGNYFLIKIITSPGSIVFEFHSVQDDLSNLFHKEDFFKNIDEADLY